MSLFYCHLKAVLPLVLSHQEFIHAFCLSCFLLLSRHQCICPVPTLSQRQTSLAGPRLLEELVPLQI